MINRAMYSDLMSRTNELILSVGGYWPVLAATSRCLEEYGEFSLAVQENDFENQIEEAIDIVIITSCIANQYCVDISGSHIKSIINNRKDIEEFSPNEFLIALADSLGNLARISLCFEGVKPLKKNEKLPDINFIYADVIFIIHCYLKKFHKKEIINEVSRISKEKSDRDKGRFTLRRDPTTSSFLKDFQKIKNKISCPFAAESKTWGAPTPVKEKSFQENIFAAVADLERFTNICRHHVIDGYVLKLPFDEKIKNINQLSTSFHAVMRLLHKFDPNKNDKLFENILTPNWQFCFNNLELFVIVVSDIYGNHSSRSTLGVSGSYILFQPTISFEHMKIPRTEDKKQTRDRIRKIFSDAGRDYCGEIIDTELEAPRYIKPIDNSDTPFAWLDTSYKDWLN